MAVREMHTYIDGTSALKMEDPQARFTVLRGNGRSSDGYQDAYFTDDLRIAYAASACANSFLAEVWQRFWRRSYSSSFGAIFASCAATSFLACPSSSRFLVDLGRAVSCCLIVCRVFLSVRSPFLFSV